MMAVMSTVVTILIVAGVLGLALALAWLPMRLVVSQIAKNVRQFIQRQRERRAIARDTPDRRST